MPLMRLLAFLAVVGEFQVVIPLVRRLYGSTLIQVRWTSGGSEKIKTKISVLVVLTSDRPS